MSDRFYLQYDLHGSGWATMTIRHDDNSVDMLASYLHDSLRELANAAHSISRGGKSSRIVFLDEPGEHQLTVVREGESDCCYSIKWFNDWDSWGLRKLPGSKDVCQGTIPVRRFVQQVHTVLWTLHDEYGESGYKERWGAHEFPLAEMNRLAGIRNS